MKSLVIVQSSFAEKKDAVRLARLLVDDRLVACAQISGPIESFYRWKGQVETAAEFILSMKTTLQGLDLVKQRLADLHPYDLPEIIVHETYEVNKEYLQWVHEEVRI